MKRRLHPDERSLWKDVTRSIAPLPKRRANDADDAEPPPPRIAPKPKSKPKAPAKPLLVAAPAAPRPAPHQEPAPLGRKARRRLARGADAIDGRLDLHGLTQAQAHDALLGYLRAARGRGAKVVLVITGKGGAKLTKDAACSSARCRCGCACRSFASYVAGFESAGIGHGGEGAMYVRLRRASRVW